MILYYSLVISLSILFIIIQIFCMCINLLDRLIFTII
ncbi:hypothetical protein ACFW04_005646 [Cataglyphis niger]